jgi:hypothetical protein
MESVSGLGATGSSQHISCNNTTNAYERTGIYPFDPQCLAWTEAIESLGLASSLERDEKRIVQFEIRPRASLDPIDLDNNDKKSLRKEIPIDKRNNFSDTEVEKLLSENIVKAWRENTYR